MTTILPSARTPWDVIGEHIGHNLSQTFPRGFEQGYNRQMGVNAFNQAQNELQQAGGDPHKMSMAIARLAMQDPNAARQLQAGMEQNQNQQSGQTFGRGYDAILNDDVEGLKQIITDPNTPLETKKQLSQLYQEHLRRADVGKRERRQRLGGVHSAYDKAIKAERARIGKEGGNRPSDRAAIEKRIKELETARDADMSRLRKDPNAYEDLSIWGGAASDFFEPDMEAEGQPQQAQGEPPKEKPVFDRNNPEHLAKLKLILDQVGGDRARANQILAEEFTKK
jgi:hypothetical protein